MGETSNFCRVCLQSKCSNFSLYLHVQNKYLPSIIESICCLLISSYDEPDALICKECALDVIKADEIIKKCQESHKILVKQSNFLKTDNREAQLKEQEHKVHQKQSIEENSHVAVLGFAMQLLPPTAATHQDTYNLIGIKQELTDQEMPEESLYVEPEMIVESILECPEANSSNEATGYRTPVAALPNLYFGTTKNSKPKKKYVRSREQYLKRKIRNLPVKEPLTLIGGAGVVRKRKPKSFHRAIPNFYFKCVLCNEFESNVASYSVTHLNTVHQIERPAIFKCQFCDAKPFIKNQSLQEHIRTIHQQQPKPRHYKCAECGKSFIKNCHLQKHLLTVHKRGTQSRPCEQTDCSKAYTDEFALKLHLEQPHSGQQPYTCHICGQSFAAIYGLRLHIKTAHPGDACASAECGYKFGNKLRFETHVRRSRCKPPPFACRYCERTYDKIGRLEEHLKALHRMDPKYY